jgi:DNA-binding NtrC family response regulator
MDLIRGFGEGGEPARAPVGSLGKAASVSRRPEPGGRVPAHDRDYVVVFEVGCSSVAALPDAGALVVGAAADADLRLRGEGVADRHARLVVQDGMVTLGALDPAAPLFVNGEPVSAPRPLASGDVVALGEVTFVLHRDPRREAARVLADPAALAARLAEETARAVRYRRPLAVLSVDLGEGLRGPREPFTKALLGAVRSSDVVAFSGGAEVVVLLPETSGAATIPADRVVRALAAFVPAARGGLATCPDDASDADALLTGARNAARCAAPGQVASMARAVVTLDVGERAIVVADPSMRRVYDLVERLAPSDMPVLVLGETGVGKEAVAAALHAWSPRKAGPFVAINCAALPETLVESELFGHERGAFTGAGAPKPGLLEGADGGTVLLDEIGELSAGAQAKLLRVLESKRFMRVGSVGERTLDVRVVAATNRALESEVEAGRFRRDLYFRLGAAAVFLPPLRDRPLDLPVLARAFLDEARARLGRPPLTLSAEAQARLARHAWPGNVRELRNAMDYVAATAVHRVVGPDELPAQIGASAPPWQRAPQAPAALHLEPPSGVASTGPRPHAKSLYEEIRELERTRILEALEESGGVRVRAAALIGMPLRTFVTKLKEHGIGSPEGRRGARTGS